MSGGASRTPRSPASIRLYLSLRPTVKACGRPRGTNAHRVRAGSSTVRCAARHARQRGTNARRVPPAAPWTPGCVPPGAPPPGSPSGREGSIARAAAPARSQAARTRRGTAPARRQAAPAAPQPDSMRTAARPAHCEAALAQRRGQHTPRRHADRCTAGTQPMRHADRGTHPGSTPPGSTASQHAGRAPPAHCDAALAQRRGQHTQAPRGPRHTPRQHAARQHADSGT
jgi:hypothetical protein